MKNKTLRDSFKVGDQVWIYLNKSKLHTSYYDTWVKGKVVGFTNKKIKCLNFATPDLYENPDFPVANYLPKNVKLNKEREKCTYTKM
tara:strand:- start:294 stop:554 length:261 start_codon:yes stop_codon:yes gene_type:complete